MDWDSYLPTYVIAPIFHLLMQEVGSDYGCCGGGGGGANLPTSQRGDNFVIVTSTLIATVIVWTSLYV